jgi:replicative DNA helicase
MAKRIEKPKVATRAVMYDAEAEKCVLGCALIDERAAETVMEKMKPDDFLPTENKLIFAAMKTVFSQGKPIDLVTVSGELERMGQAAEIGGMSYLSALTTLVPSAANCGWYVETVKNWSLKRALFLFGNYISERAQSEIPGEELVPDFCGCLETIAAYGAEKGLEPIKGAAGDEFDRIARAAKGEISPFGLRTGYREFDRLLWGLQKQCLYVVAARPSVGKTAFALNIAARAALKYGKKCAFFSLETSAQKIARRLLCIIGSLENNGVMDGSAYRGDAKKVAWAAETLAKAGIYVNDERDVSAAEMLMQCKRMKRTAGLDLVVIDYLTLMPGTKSTKTASKSEAVGDAVRDVKGIARKLDVPVLLLSQTTREAGKTKIGDIDNTVFRDSGEVEQEADVGFYMASDSPEDADVKDVYLKTVKNKDGKKSNFRFRFTGSMFLFEEIASNPATANLEPLSEAEQEKLGF